MSEIQRYQPFVYCDGKITASVDLHVKNDGAYCRYSDLVFYRRMYGMAATMLVAVCIVFAAFLVMGKHAPQPVRQAAESSQPWHALSDKIDQMLETHHQAVASYDAAWKDREKRDRDWAKRVANLEAQIKAHNALLNPAQQTEVLKLAAKPMHDGELFKLAKGFGFTKVRVVE